MEFPVQCNTGRSSRIDIFVVNTKSCEILQGDVPVDVCKVVSLASSSSSSCSAVEEDAAASSLAADQSCRTAKY